MLLCPTARTIVGFADNIAVPGHRHLASAARAYQELERGHPRVRPIVHLGFSSELGTYAAPNFAEAVLGGGGATVGQPVGLKRASGADPSEDILPRAPRKGATVADFYAAGLVSVEANSHYGRLAAVQQEYAPLGIRSGLCVGLASVAYQDQGLTLQPCSVPGTAVWALHPALAPTTPGYFPIINDSTTDFSRPFAMHLPRNEVASGSRCRCRSATFSSAPATRRCRRDSCGGCVRRTELAKPAAVTAPI